MGAMATVMAGGRMFDVALDALVNEFINEVRRHPIFEVRTALAAQE